MQTATLTDRQFVYPTVRCTSRTTAHSAAQAWSPAASRERSVVVLPSRTIEKWSDDPAETQAFEERLLCSLLELRDPALRMTYITSAPISPAIVDYYLSLLPRPIRSDARRRLSLVALGDRSRRPLSAKLLARPEIMERIRRTLAFAGGERDRSYVSPYNTTELERDVALALDTPLYGADPVHSHFGTKSGCRALFARGGVPHPVGTEGLGSLDEVVAAIGVLREAKPELAQVVVKLNNGVSGEGNALVDLHGVSDSAELAQRVAALAPEAPEASAEAFLAKLAAGGGIVEEWIAASDIRSPSVQLQITPEGEVRVVSTHDQILGGPSGQTYLGCRFPADAGYAPSISVLALRLGRSLADAGVIGRLAIDFVVARDCAGDPWRPYAIELNLRKGGTTHPYETLAQLTGGSYNPQSAAFVTLTGQHKHYVATDHLQDDVLRALGSDGVLALARREDLGFHPLRRTGVVFHMLSSLDELGRCGFTAIADSAEEADALYEHVQHELLAAARERRARSAELPLAV